MYNLQFGFRADHSVNHALISLTESIKNSLDNRKFGCGIFLDLQKASDAVNHQILLNKLHHYGIRGTALAWFTSYISNRSQYVSVNGYNSSHRNITCGVPQGSVPGPLLFLIYINDLPSSSSKLSFYLFADDINIYFESDSPNTLQKVVNKVLRHVKRWLYANKLSLNVDKTNVVIFHSPQNPLNHSINIKIGNQYVKQTKYVKFLGLLLDENLSWKYHISELSKKLSRNSGIFIKVRHLVPTSVLISLYNSLFSSFLQYGVIVWGLTHEVQTKPIYLLQKKVVRAIAFKSSLSQSTPIFSDLKILKLNDLFELKLFTFVYESVNMVSPVLYHNFFATLTSVHHYNTRQASKGDIFMTQENTLQYGLKSIRYAGAKSWNNIACIIKRSTTVTNFRRKLKLHLFSTRYQQ